MLYVCVYISLDHGLDNESHIIISDLKLVTVTKLISKGFTQGVDCLHSGCRLWGKKELLSYNMTSIKPDLFFIFHNQSNPTFMFTM